MLLSMFFTTRANNLQDRIIVNVIQPNVHFYTSRLKENLIPKIVCPNPSIANIETVCFGIYQLKKGATL